MEPFCHTPTPRQASVGGLRMPRTWQTSRHAVHALHVHLILTPKYRRAVMTPRVTDLLKQVCTEVCDARGATVMACETDGDHMHLLVQYPPTLTLADWVMTLQSVTARRLRAQHWPEITQQLWGAPFWSPSYCVLSVGGVTLDTVKRYVENQQTPDHRRRARSRRP